MKDLITSAVQFNIPAPNSLTRWIKSSDEITVIDRAVLTRQKSSTADKLQLNHEASPTEQLL